MGRLFAILGGLAIGAALAGVAQGQATATPSPTDTSTATPTNTPTVTHTAIPTFTPTVTNTPTTTPTNTATAMPTRRITPIATAEIPTGSSQKTWRVIVHDVAAGYNGIDLRNVLPQSGFTPTECEAWATTKSGGGATPAAAAASCDQATLDAQHADVYVGTGAGGTVILQIR